MESKQDCAVHAGDAETVAETSQWKQQLSDASAKEKVEKSTKIENSEIENGVAGNVSNLAENVLSDDGNAPGSVKVAENVMDDDENTAGNDEAEHSGNESVTNAEPELAEHCQFQPGRQRGACFFIRRG